MKLKLFTNAAGTRTVTREGFHRLHAELSQQGGAGLNCDLYGVIHHALDVTDSWSRVTALAQLKSNIGESAWARAWGNPRHWSRGKPISHQ